MELPLYMLEISDDLLDDAEVNFIALVDRPAVKKNWNAFKDRQKFEVVSKDRRIISGVFMLADTPIYRNDVFYGEYYVAFSKDTIFKICKKFFQKGYQNNVNLDHNPDLATQDVTIFESFLVDSARGITPMKGFEDAPEGSWMGSMYVNSDAIWQEVLDGTYQGFSVEGMFNYALPMSVNTEDEKILTKIANILEKHKLSDK